MPRETLTRAQIVRAAVELLDAEGLDGLSMRALGTRLGSAATAVYWHVKNKEDLVVLAADAVWDEIELPDPAAVEWRTAATAMATGMFTMIMRHPWLVPAMSTHLLHGPGKARHDDHLLAVYEAAGFRGRAVQQALTTVFTFVLGTAVGAAAEVAWRARVRRAGGDEEAELQAAIAEIAEVATRFPRLLANSEGWADGDPTAEGGSDLDYGLRAILDGLEAQLPQRW